MIYACTVIQSEGSVALEMRRQQCQTTNFLTGLHFNVALWCLALSLAMVPFANAQQAEWKTQVVDSGGGRGISLAVDLKGDLHMSYTTDDGQVRYAYRPATSRSWYIMTIATTNVVTDTELGGVFTRIATDSDNNPHICYTSPGVQYARFNSATHKWDIQQLMSARGVTGFACGIGIASDGTPYVSWYQEDDPATRQLYLHLKAAALEHGNWLLRTVDFDTATGKWNQLAVDKNGMPHISYSAFVSGHMKYASWNGKDWLVSAVEAPIGPKLMGLSMGNALALGPDGQAQISYFDERSLKYAKQNGSTWSVERIDSIAPRGLGFEEYRSSIGIDSNGLPHIAYEDSGFLKYAYYDGKRWNKQVVIPSGTSPFLFNSLVVGPNDVIFMAYRDPMTGAVSLATGGAKAPISGSRSRE